MARTFWIALGLLALAFGALGVVLPVLPTAPFVILAAFAFAKGSPRLAKMLEDHRMFGPIIEDWRHHGAIAPKFKAIALGMMIATFGVSLAVDVAAKVLVVQAICMGGAALFIVTRPNR